MEVSTSTLTMREGETVSYSVRLSEQPLADGWWVFVQVDGVVYHDGEFTKPGETEPWIRWVPSVGWKTDPVPESSDPTRWRTVSITARQDDDDDDEFLTFTHEVWDKDTNCPEFLHAVAPVQVRIIDDDRPGGTAPDLEIQDAEVTEGGIAAFTVTLSSSSEVPVTVSYETIDGTATAGADYTTTSGTLSFTPGQTTKRVEVQTLQDTDQEGAESFTVRLSGATGATLTDGVATGTIFDDDDRPSLRIGDARETEGGTAAFTVTLSSAATGAVTVSYATVDGTATAGADYTSETGTLTFEVNGETTQRIEVQTLQDTEQEATETFTVRLSAVTGARLADATGTGTIIDDDGGGGGGGTDPPPLEIGDASVTEGGTATFAVTLGSGATGPVTVSYQTQDGTASADSDYTSETGTLTFEVNGETTQRIEVQTLQDTEQEATETFTVRLSAVTGARLADATGTGTIIDDDGGGGGGGGGSVPRIEIEDAEVTEGGIASFEVTLSSAPTRAVTVAYRTVDGTAVAGADYTTTSGMLTFEVNGDRTQRVEVPTLEDDEAEETETFTVQLSAPSGATVADGTGTGTIIDDDGGGGGGGSVPRIEIEDAEVTEGGIASFEVTLSSAPTRAVTVAYRTVDGTAVAGADYTTTSGMLTFEVNGDRTQRVEVPTLEDDEAEETETFTVQLSAPSGATVADGTGTGTIIDDDGGGGGGGSVPRIEIEDAEVTEGGIASFEVTLSSAPTRAVTVAYRTVDGTAVAGADYTTTSGMLTFEVNGDRTQRVEVPTLEDDEAEETETFTVQLSAPSGATVADGTGTGTITDNDEAPTITIGDAEPVRESGTAEFTVRLSSASGRPVTVAYRTVDGTAVAGADYTAAGGTLEFQPGATTRTITVGTLTDGLLESPERFTVELGDPAGAVLGDATGEGTITDDVQRSSRGVHRIVLPEMARAMAFTPNCRIEQALSGAPVQLAGDGGRARLSLSSALTSGRRTGPGAEPLTIDQALDDVRFLTSSQQEGGSGGFAAWGCADRLSLNGGGAGAVPWNGDVFSAHLGADVRLGSDVVAGFSLSRLRGSFEYRMGGSGGGEAAGAYEPRMTGIHPFLVWSVTPAVKLWATYGHGWGELQFTNDLAGRGDTGSSTLNSGIVGFVGRLLVRGATTVRVKGEWAIAYMDLGAADRGLFDALKVDAQRVRYRAEVRQEHFLASGHWLSPWAELGFRHDAGDGERGGGLELGGGLRYRNSDTGLSVESEGRWLAFHQSTIHEWGFGTRILYDPGASERGVSVGLTPTWGRTASGVAQLWEQGSAVPTSYDATGPRLEAHVGYGFGVPRRRGALTPYVSMALGDEVARSYRVGSHLATGRSTNVNLELERRGHGAAPATYGITARGTILF